MLAGFDWNSTLGFMKVFGHYDCGGHGAGRDRHGRQKPTISVAGYLATAGQWYEHHRLWRKRLKADGFSEFHMTDFMANSKDFQKCKNWDESRKLAFLNDLIKITVDNVTFAIGMAVRRADYDKVLSEEPEIINALGRPFAFCAFRCFESGADWSIKHRSLETINYIFERGDPGAEQVDQTHKFLCEFEPIRRRFWLGSLTFEPKCNTSLQAADLLTWALNREFYHQLYPEPEYESIRPTLTNLLASVDNMYKGYYEDDLRGYLKDLMDKRTRNRNKKKSRFSIINIPQALAPLIHADLKARAKTHESKDRVRKVRRNNARTVGSAAKRTKKTTSTRTTSKSAKKKAG